MGICRARIAFHEPIPELMASPISARSSSSECFNLSSGYLSLESEKFYYKRE